MLVRATVIESDEPVPNRFRLRVRRIKDLRFCDSLRDQQSIKRRCLRALKA